MRWPGAAGSRDAWVGWAVALAWATVVFNVAEGLLSLGFGAADGSIALLGFGADSFIEVGSALLVLWRLRDSTGDRPGDDLRRERLATRGIGLLLALLGLATAVGAALQVVARRHPDTARPALLISLVSLLLMFALWRAKLRVARALDSMALASDAACSLACMKLSCVVLAGSLIFVLLPAFWWADAAAASVLAGLIGLEGWGMVRASRKPGFAGGCGCAE
ncbi:MAG: cation transporter [Thermoanaerobaculaceae bacterium]|nr:cation transporter [Thermoanaerobaculaceae bacterium]TAM57007.1 MAG: heavy metal transporter [Acidobacteriota bacterium]